MCDRLRSGRNRWWLLIKLSIPVHVTPHPPPSNTPQPKKNKKNPSLSHQDKRLPHEFSSRPEIPPTHTNITHGTYIALYPDISVTISPIVYIFNLWMKIMVCIYIFFSLQHLHWISKSIYNISMRTGRNEGHKKALKADSGICPWTD